LPAIEPRYAYYQKALEGQPLPLAYVDLDLFDENIGQIIPRAGEKTIRVASKSVRCVELLQRVFAAHDIFQGLMCFTVPEALWLSEKGFDDLLVGYPCWQPRYIEAVAQAVKAGKQITLMVDAQPHVAHINAIAEAAQTVIPICMDIDMSSSFPGLHFGVWRSSIFNKADALRLAEFIGTCPHVRLEGVMGYEAQIAGVGDNAPGKAVMNAIIRFLKKRSIKEIAKRRAAIVAGLRQMGFELRFVNGGGTGSLESTRQEAAVTEVTVGSGFYASALFDHYRQFRHLPAAAFAVEIVRQPKPGLFTCHGGGYIASGATGTDKQPAPFLPAGVRLTANEATGEVQTPCLYKGREPISLGDPIFFRHSKAGELCERFNKLYLISGGQIVDQAPTYRGEGQCFL